MKAKSPGALPQHAADNSSAAGQPQRLAARRLISLREAAELLGVSVTSVRRLVWAGRLPAVRLTRRVQVDLHDLDRIIQQEKHGGV